MINLIVDSLKFIIHQTNRKYILLNYFFINNIITVNLNYNHILTINIKSLRKT